MRGGYLTMLMAIMLGAIGVNAQAALAQGSMQYDTASNQMVFNDGSGWFYFAAALGTGSCSVPSEMNYDRTLKTYRYCNGSAWMKVVGLPSIAPCATEGELTYRNGSFFFL